MDATETLAAKLEADDRPLRGPRTSRLVALILLATGAVAACAYHATGELVDDAYIDFRYAANLVAGRGLVFNPGDRVEGYTNFLWVIVLSTARSLGVDPEWSTRLLGGAFAVATVLVTAAWLAGENGRPLWSTLLAPVLLALNPLWGLWAESGLETTLFTLLVTLGLRSDGRRRREGSDGPRSALFYALATLTRPEGALFFAVSLAYRAFQPSVRERWALVRAEVVTYGAIVAIFVAWRLSYYGDILPNTFYAKTSFSTAGVPRGLAYLAAFFADAHSAPLFLLLLPTLLLASRRFELRLVSWVIFVYLTGVALEGGDGFPAFRQIVPILPALYFLIQEGAVGLLELLRRRTARWTVPALAAVCAAAALCHLANLTQLAHRVRSQNDGFTATRRLAGLALREQVPPSTTIALCSIGAVPYFSGLYAYDMLGLTDRHIARMMPRDFGRGRAGHEKGDGRYILDQRPDLILIGNVLTAERSLPVEKALAMEWPYFFHAEAELVTDPDLYRLYSRDAVRMPNGQHLMLLRRKDYVLSASAVPSLDRSVTDPRATPVSRQ